MQEAEREHRQKQKQAREEEAKQRAAAEKAKADKEARQEVRSPLGSVSLRHPASGVVQSRARVDRGRAGRVRESESALCY